MVEVVFENRTGVLTENCPLAIFEARLLSTTFHAVEWRTDSR